MTEFIPFNKLARLNRQVTISEKLNGTNGTIYIGDDGEFLVGSRTRWITTSDDNFGFARWAEENKQELLKLGPGWHRGEWVGRGIQCNYGLKDRRFYLFNTFRWTDDAIRPSCCHVVPVLYEGAFSTFQPKSWIALLNAEGSVAFPGWKDPEGIVIYHQAANQYFKVTCKNDESPKSLVK